MNLRHILAALLVLTAIPLDAGENIWKKLNAETSLPPELESSVDVFPVRVGSTTDRLILPPYRITKRHYGIQKTSLRSDGLEIDSSGIRSYDTAVRARRHDSFTVEYEKRPVMRCDCIWKRAYEAGATKTECDLAMVEAAQAWHLVLDSADHPGRGGRVATVGSLRGESADFAIEYVWAELPGALGELPAAIYFTIEEVPFAAMQFKAGAPTRFTVMQSITPDERLAMVASIAAIGFADRDWAGDD